MSRTNPYKKKPRSANKTILVYTEGLSEETFLKYLRGLYSRNKNIIITIKRGRGGTADGLVLEAHRTQGEFDIKILVLDNDKEVSEMIKARNDAHKKNISLYEHTPCLEAILLSILYIGKNFENKKSGWCKSEFKSKCLDNKKRTEINEYAKLFPKKLLDKQRTKIPELDKLIALIEGKTLMV